ncbi:biotin transporter BioY [Rhodococcus sp. NPDC059234]|uniref:biotin transporter BioY n=1 Tax=Rhodococcus sp. NPDC059234 TaxID=3346781 RepID=UPI00366C9153
MSTRISGAPKFSARDLAQVAVFAALIIALGLPGTINIGTSGVPITLQTLGVMLAGALLGPRKGVLSVLTVIALGLALPVLAGGRTSLTSLSSPTAGFLIGWIPTVAVIGWLTVKLLPRYNVIVGTLINLIGGIVVLYAFGIAGMMVRADLTFAKALSLNVTFLPGDAIKAVVAAAVAAQVHRAYPALLTGAAVTPAPAPAPAPAPDAA